MEVKQTTRQPKATISKADVNNPQLIAFLDAFVVARDQARGFN
jgi:hypothetical protein